MAAVKVTRQGCTPLKCHFQQAAHRGSSDMGTNWFLLKTLCPQVVMLWDCCSQVSASPSASGLWSTRGYWEDDEHPGSPWPHALPPTAVYEKLLHSIGRRTVMGISDVMFLCHPWPAPTSSCKPVYLKEISQRKRDYLIEQTSVPHKTKLTHASLLLEFVSFSTGAWFLFSLLARWLPCTSVLPCLFALPFMAKLNHGC